ncbi:hypothetical protein ANO11243_082400 [Dothideomycetidae sp. 11243]|nr:hypothetical protein ANO11243_082400 [fungal sp. No.11243]
MKSFNVIGSVVLALLASGTEASSSKCDAMSAYSKKVQEHMSYPIDFCVYYLSSPRTRTPLAMSVQALHDSCCCLLDAAEIPIPKHHTSSAPAYADSNKRVCSIEFKHLISKTFYEPKRFCKFFDAFPRSVSPIPGVTAEQLLDGCECFDHHHHTTTTTTTTKHKKPKHTTPPVEPTGEVSPTASETGAASPTSSALVCETDVPSYIYGRYEVSHEFNKTFDGNFTLAYNGAGHTGFADYVQSIQTTTLANNSLQAVPAISSCLDWVAQAQQPAQGSYAVNVYENATTNAWTCLLYTAGDYPSYNATNSTDSDVLCSYGYNEIEWNCEEC